MPPASTKDLKVPAANTINTISSVERLVIDCPGDLDARCQPARPVVRGPAVSAADSVITGAPV